MKGTSRAFKLFVNGVICAGLFTLLWFRPNVPRGEWLGVLTFVALTFLAEAFCVALPKGNGTVSVGFAVVYASILLYGAEVGQWVAAIGTIGPIDLSGKVAPVKILFNRSALALSAYAAGRVYQLLGGTPSYQGPQAGLLPLVVCGLVYSLINTSLVVLAVSLQVGANPLGIWNTEFRWAVPSLLALVPLSIVLANAYASMGVGAAAVFFVPLLLARYSFKRYIDLRETYLQTMKALMAVLDAKDPCTHGHSERVARYAVAIGRRMNLPEEDVELLEYVGILHDVGKIGIRDCILKKPGKFTEEEYMEMKRHTDIGSRIIEHIRLLGKGAGWVRHHHERYDGAGFPDGLKGEEIPLGARIIAAADAFDAMTSDRPYKKAYTLEQAKAEMLANSGTQFDPRIVEVFIEYLNEVTSESGIRG